MESHAKGDVLYRWRERSDDLLVVLRGRISISRPTSRSARLYLRSLGPAEIVGWSTLVGEPRTADLVASTDVQVARIPGTAVRRLFEKHPQIPLRLIATLGALVGSLSDEISELRFQSLDEREMSAIARLTGSAPRLEISRPELAEAVRATRPNVSRAWRRLEDKQLIRRERGWIKIG